MKTFKTGLKNILQINIVFQRFRRLLKAPVFWVLTLWGNLFVVIGTLFMHFVEGPVNPPAQDIYECFIWSVGLVTTVGASDLHPVTIAGKLLMIAMMMGGAFFLWSYMAFFIGALVEPELKTIEAEVSGLQKRTEQDEELLEQIRNLLKAREISSRSTDQPF